MASSSDEGDDLETASASNRPAASAPSTSSQQMTADTNADADSEDDQRVTEPEEDDVLCGRGAPSTDYPGNVKFRELVKDRRDEYVNAKRRKEKQRIAGEIIATVKARGGRFLERLETFRRTNLAGESKKTTIWQEVTDRKTLLVKVKQLMRDVGPDAQEKRNLRREQRRMKEMEECTKKEDADDKKVAAVGAQSKPSAEPTASPASLPAATFPPATSQFVNLPYQLPALPLGSFTGITPQPGFLGDTTGGSPLVRLRMEQEAAMQQDALLRQRLQQQQSNAAAPVAYTNFPAYSHNALFPSHNESILQHQLRIAQEEALLQHHLQQRAQGMYQQTNAGINLPTASLASQAYLLQPEHQQQQQQQQQPGDPQVSLLAAIMRRNAGPSSASAGANLYPRQSGEEKEKRKLND